MSANSNFYQIWSLCQVSTLCNINTNMYWNFQGYYERHVSSILLECVRAWKFGRTCVSFSFSYNKLLSILFIFSFLRFFHYVCVLYSCNALSNDGPKGVQWVHAPPLALATLTMYLYNISWDVYIKPDDAKKIIRVWWFKSWAPKISFWVRHWFYLW